MRLYGLMKKKLILIFSKISFTSSFFQYQAASQMNLVWWLTFLSANSCKNKNKYYKNINLNILHVNIKQEFCSYFIMLPYSWSYKKIQTVDFPSVGQICQVWGEGSEMVISV